MQKVYYGPFTISIDDTTQETRVELVRRGPKSWQLLDGEIAKLRDYVLEKARGFGFPVVEV